MKGEDTGENFSREECSSCLNRGENRREVREVGRRIDARWLRRFRSFGLEEVEMEVEETVGNSSEVKKEIEGSSFKAMDEGGVSGEMDNRSEVGAMRRKQ